MAIKNEENETAKTDLKKEREAMGFGPKPPKDSQNLPLDEEEHEDMGELEDEETDEDVETEEEEEETSEDESEDDDTEEEDEDEEDDSEKNQSKKKKNIPVEQFNQLRKELRAANQKIADMETNLPDNFQEKVDEFAKELGVQDPENLKKIVKFMKEAVVDKNTSKLEKQIADLQKEVRENKASSVVDEFPIEWSTFDKDFFSKEFPNATDDQKKQAKEIMKTLAHSSKTGGKPYTDPKSGKEVLDPYPLDYIFFKHREKFAAVVTEKKKKGMESARTQGITRSKDNDDDEEKHLPKNASADDIRKLDKKFAKMESGAFDSMRSPENAEI